MDEDYTLMSPCFNDSFNLTIYSTPFKCSKLEISVTTCLPLQTDEEIETIEMLCDAADAVWFAGFWFSVVTGILGNGLAILTVASLPTSTATFFVGLLAASDLVAVCIQVLVHFLDKHRLYSRYTAYWDLFPMLYDISASYSNWLLVLICLERYFTIRFPLHKRYYFTLTHAKVSAGFLALGIFTIYNSVTWTLGYENMKMYKIRNLFYAGLPLAFILIIIILISYQLRRIHIDRKSLNWRVHSKINLPLTEDFQATGSSSRRQSSCSPLQEIARLENSITIMMLVAAVCFSLLTIPYCVLLYTYLDSAVSWNTPVLRARWHMFGKISQVLAFLNLSVNFVLYFLSAKKFRSQLFKVISRRSISLARNPSQNNQALNNNSSKTDNSHHVVDIDYLQSKLINVTSPNTSEQNTLRKSIMEGVPLKSLPECSLLKVDTSEKGLSDEL